MVTLSQPVYYGEALALSIELIEDLVKLRDIMVSVRTKYCMLVRLDRADAINLDEILDKDTQEFIESLLELYRYECRVDF